MSLEGRLRELGLAEVLQLLAVSRKSGVLHLEAPLHGRHAAVQFQHGSVVNAAVWNAYESTTLREAWTASEAREIEAVMLDLLRWRDGAFRFAPADEDAATRASVRLAIEPLLMEAAHRAEVWSRIEDRVPHSRVVPAFVDVEPQQLPLLRLAPAQWEILTRVDGQRDLLMLAESLGRDVVVVAEQVHGLLEAGLLILRDGPVAPRRNPTPPAIAAISGPVGCDLADDLWIPAGDHTRHSSSPPEGSGMLDDFSIFDPVELQVAPTEEFPRPRTPWMASAPVASRPVEPSLPRREVAEIAARVDASSLCRLGDDAARRGNFAVAITHWNAALQLPEPFADVDRVRETIALTARLHALLHP